MSRKKGKEPLITSVKDTLDTPWITKRFIPTGGVRRPVSRVIPSTTPSQRGSKPRLIINGKTMGSVTNIIEITHIRHPRMRYITTINPQITNGLKPEAAIRLHNCAGILSRLRAIPSIFADTTIRKHMAVISSALKAAFFSTVKFSFPNMADSNIATTPLTAADSVAVMKPP